MKLLGCSFSSQYRRFSLYFGLLILIVLLYTLYTSDAEGGYLTSTWGLNVLMGADQSYDFGNQNTNASSPIILLWTAHYGQKVDWIPSPRTFGCAVDCQITSNRKLLKRSVAVVFYPRSLYVNDLPHWSKNSGQKWILYNGESPANTPLSLFKPLQGKIHWTATHRRDSDFFAPYGMLVAKNETENSTGFSVTERKPYLVCCIVSNCHTSSQRESYVRELRQYVTLMVYGFCGPEKCPDASSEHCYNHISKSCKFYLSFENSICPDYSTEKLFNALNTDMVPVVMGGDNYSLTLPEHSYINVMDFPSPKDLADYLLELDGDPSKFKAYHMWKTKYKVIDPGYSWICDCCQKLHDNSSAFVRPYKDLISWWFGDHKCPAWTKIIKND